MYSNRQGVNIYITDETNGKALSFPVATKQLERISLTLMDFRFDNLLNNITPLNQRLKITHMLGGVLDITIPVRHYNVIELRDKLNELMSPYITVTYSDYRYSFVSTHSFTVDEETTCRKILGMGSSFPLTASLYPAYTLNLPKRVNMIASDYITIRIPEFDVNLISPREPADNIYARIPVNSPYGETIFYRPSNKYNFLLRKPNLRVLTLNLTDDLGNKIEDSFSCNISIEYVYLPEDQELHEDVEELKDKLPFTHSEGNIKIKPFINKGGFSIG